MGAVRTVVIVLLLEVVASSGTAQAPMTGAEAVRMIDWNALGLGSPIPAVMPMADSDDPVGAGFAREWIERALDPGRPSLGGLALEIVSKPRMPGDRWAYGMVKELRAIVHSKLHRSTISRVFCNSVGCLCYVERDVSPVNPVVSRELVGELGQKFGLKRSDLDLAWSNTNLGPPWELTVVRHPSTDSPITPWQTRSDISP